MRGLGRNRKVNEAELFKAYRNSEVEKREIKVTGKEEREVEEGEVKTHQDHAALGENHWFTCGLCDDEDPDG